MVASNAFIAASCLSAFLGAFVIAFSGFEKVYTHARSRRLQQRLGNSNQLRLLQEGIPVLHRPAQILLGNVVIRRYCKRVCGALAQKGIIGQEQGFLSTLMTLCLAVVTLGFLLGRFALGLLAGSALILFIGAWANRTLELRTQRMRDALPDALQAMSSCFGAGFTLQQTFSYLEQELKGPLSSLFRVAASSMKTGSSSQYALTRIQKEGGIPELSFVSVALAVQHQTGGSMQHVLDATRDSLKAELELQQSLRIHTAQAKLSARVVVGVTIGLVAAMMLISRDFLQPFFESSTGFAMLLLAFAMQVSGVLIVRHLLNAELT